MVEKDRQLVIFGNFERISFESIGALVNLKDQFGLSLGGQEEERQIQPNAVQPIIQTFAPPSIRPVLRSNDGKFVVFFGTKRIHIEEKESNSLDYITFIEKARSIIITIITTFSITVDRMAINGTLFSNDNGFILQTFSRFFKNNDLSRQDMDDWAFRINNKGHESYRWQLNRIVSSQLRKEMISNIPTNCLYLSYDYNTIPNQGLFTVEDLNNFINAGIEFRHKVVLHEETQVN